MKRHLVKGESRGNETCCFEHGRAVKMRSKGIFKERFCLFGFV